jgi:hypothetical protein
MLLAVVAIANEYVAWLMVYDGDMCRTAKLGLSPRGNLMEEVCGKIFFPSDCLLKRLGGRNEVQVMKASSPADLGVRICQNAPLEDGHCIRSLHYLSVTSIARGK